MADLVPWVYGSLKIHKPDKLLFLITNYIGSLAYATLTTADLFKPLMDKTSYHIKNTVTFSKELKDLQVEEDEIMNSHDVVSLFSYVPIKKASEVISEMLNEDKTLIG